MKSIKIQTFFISTGLLSDLYISCNTYSFPLYRIPKLFIPKRDLPDDLLGNFGNFLSIG